MHRSNHSKKITANNDISFIQKDGQSILDASIEAGFPINHSCRSGRCGFCKAKVLAGKTITYRREALTPKELNDNWVLTCARTAATDIEIDAGQLCKVDTPKVMTIPCVISQITLESN